MKRVLIACDGSDSSKEAVFDLRRAGLPEECHALVYSVADVQTAAEVMAVVGEASFPPEHAFAFRNAYEESRSAVQVARLEADKGAEWLRHLFPEWEVEAGSCAESPVHAICEKVRTWKPDLLVIGSHSHAPWGHFLFGSVSMGLLNRVDCDIRIGRGRIEENTEPTRLVVGIDGSLSALSAAEEVLSRHWTQGTAVHFVTGVDARLITSIIHPDMSVRQWVKENDPEPLAWVYRMLQHYVEKARAKGLAASSKMRQDDPKDVLLDEAARWGADCIFLGSRGLGLGGRLFLGSVSTAVAARAHCSVEVVKG